MFNLFRDCSSLFRIGTRSYLHLVREIKRNVDAFTYLKHWFNLYDNFSFNSEGEKRNECEI